jgi:copper chaperone CopZ
MHKQLLTKQILLFSLIIALISCSGNRTNNTKEEIEQEVSLMEVSIEGMTCTGCEQTIQKNISKLDGIKSIKASFTEGSAIIEYFSGKADTGKIKEAVTGSGYSVKKITALEQ